MSTPVPPPHAASLLSVEQVAAILKLNVRTIRNYVRAGTLRATRIGKQYRIALDDLESFAGRPLASVEQRALAPGGRVEVSSVIQIEGVAPALASRITGMLAATAEVLGSLKEPVAVSTSYDGPRERLRVLLAADLKGTRDFLAMIHAALEPPTAR
jgi:excisionase family DNA binding protein